MVISFGADHGGYAQKEVLVAYLKNAGYEVIDNGAFSEESVDYPDFAKLVADDVACGKASFGILVCGTGIGMAIAANKVKGVRAANVTSASFAKLAREHNDANVLTLSGRFVSVEENKAAVDMFLSSEFQGGRHSRRVDKITSIEAS